MSEAHTITGWLADIQGGSEQAIEQLVQHYFDRLVGVGKKTYREQFADMPRPAEDEEDAALSALDSFCAAIQNGRVQNLANRHQLWKLLAKITIRKVFDQRERATAKKRGGKDAAGSAVALGEVISELPSPQAQAELKDTYRAAMEMLRDPELKRIAEMDLEGRSRAEIAETLGVTERTVYRELAVINERWDRLFAEDR